jgi:hypothetical protein
MTMIDRRTMLSAAAAATLLGPRATMAAAEKTKGWRPLFDGSTLEGWTFFQDGGVTRDTQGAVAIEDGVLHFYGSAYRGTGKAAFGHIATVETWSNYHLRLDFRWGVKRFAPRRLQRRNSGILYHLGPERDRLYPDGVEFQVEETDVGDAIMINTRALPGPLLGGTPLWPTYFPGLPRTYETPVVAGGIARQWIRHAGNFETLDGWNTLDLYAFGDQAAHLVNGRIVTTLFAMRTSRDTPLTGGRIALELEAAEVLYRNVMIRTLSDADIAAIRANGS